MDLELYLTSYIKMNSKQITDPNVRDQTVKLLEENIVNLYDLGIGSVY